MINITSLDKIKTENMRRLISYLDLSDNIDNLSREELIVILFEEGFVKTPNLGWTPTYY